jgi:hypothetical protein
MAKMLNIDELWQVAKHEGHTDLLRMCAELEAMARNLAHATAHVLCVRCGSGDFWDQGFMVGFSPIRDGDEVPPALEHIDPEGEWVVNPLHVNPKAPRIKE